MQAPAGEDVRARLNSTLKERAAEIKCARNDVFTVKYWQIGVNFALCGGAVAFLVCFMATDGVFGYLLGAIAVIAAMIIFTLSMRSYGPTSFLQYTATDGERRYCFQILSKTRALFSDGERVVTVDGNMTGSADTVYCPQYRFDFFADMDADMRIKKGDTETFKGTVEYQGRTLRCKMVFKDGVPYYGVVAGARIKYFDVNSTREKFVVSDRLKSAVTAAGIKFPKLPGVHVNGGYKDLTKQ